MTFYDLLDDEEEEEDEEDDAESAASDHETDGNGDDGAGGDDDGDDCGGGHGMSLDASDVHPPRCVRASCCAISAPHTRLNRPVAPAPATLLLTIPA
jgi:hypothetical protein